MTEKKTVKVDPRVWRKLGIAARKYGVTMQELASEAIVEHLMRKEAEQEEEEDEDG